MDIETELINRGLVLKHSGKDYVLTNCPFPDHEDTNPSFSINLRNGNFICFGCGQKGDFYDLLSVLDGVSVEEAHRRYKNVIKTETSIFGLLGEILEDTDKKFIYYSKSSFFKVFGPITYGSKAYAYLKNRKLNDKVIKRFDLRWGGSVFRFANRIIIPIYSDTGKLVTYAGRTIVNEQPKTRKTRSFSSTLFGLYQLIRYRTEKRMRYGILVEGEFDCMYLQKFRLNAVCSMGKRLSDTQIYLLRKYFKKIIVSYDGDSAGIDAMWGKGNVLDRLKKYIPAFGVRLPENKDPNELTKEEVYEIYETCVR